MREIVRRQEQLEARKNAMLELAAIKVQQAYRGHKGRGDAALLRKTRELRKIQVEKEKHAAAFLQRIYRGHRGRKIRDLNKELERVKQLKNQKASKLQSVFRGHKDRQLVKKYTLEEQEKLKLKAVLRIQKNWRGVRERHLASIMMGLLQLRRREDKAARVIQSKCRAYLSRGLIKALKMVIQAKERRLKCAVTIQKVFRGYKGRERKEVVMELRKLEVFAKPLFMKINKYQENQVEMEVSINTLRKSLAIEQQDEVRLAKLLLLIV